MSDEEEFDRPLPAHLFRQMLEGKLDAHQALERAREHYQRSDVRGGDMNTRIWAALGNTAPLRRAERIQAARDARGRFAREQEQEGQAAQPTTMNDLIREQLATGTSTGGTLDMDLSHLSGGPAPDDEA